LHKPAAWFFRGILSVYFSRSFFASFFLHVSQYFPNVVQERYRVAPLAPPTLLNPWTLPRFIPKQTKPPSSFSFRIPLLVAAPLFPVKFKPSPGMLAYVSFLFIWSVFIFFFLFSICLVPLLLRSYIFANQIHVDFHVMSSPSPCCLPRLFLRACLSCSSFTFAIFDREALGRHKRTGTR